MRSIFCPEGGMALRRAVETSALLVFDFDGTLAPIVDDPADAATPRETAEHLRSLLRRFRIAIVSGRARQDLAPRLGFEPTFLVGNHGAEGLADAAPAGHEAAAAWIRARIAAEAPRLQAAGIRFEDKGQSWTLHYRQAPDPAQAQQAIQALLTPLHPGLETLAGKCCVNLVLAGAPTKGHAVQELVARTGAASVVFMGDDATDESVYRLSRPSWLTIHVGPAGAANGASFHVDSQREVVNVIRLLRDLSATMPLRPVPTSGTPTP
jgi:trehalose 6-phosphate phosphatase